MTATRGLHPDIVHAMREACDRDREKQRKILEKARIADEKRRKRAEPKEKKGKKKKKEEEEAPALVNSEAEEDSSSDEEDEDVKPVPSLPVPPSASQEAQRQVLGATVTAPMIVSLSQQPSQDQHLDERALPPGPARKKRRLGAETDALHVMASHIEIEDLQAAAGNARVWQRYGLELHNLESKYVISHYKAIASTPALRKRAFPRGEGFPQTWARRYEFLQPVDVIQLRDNELSRYYSRIPLGFEKLRGDVPSDQDLVTMTDAQLEDVNDKAWTMAAAWGVAGPDAERFRDPRHYYPGLFDAYATADDALKAIPKHFKEFLRPGVDAPWAFPETSRVVRVLPTFLFPELLVTQPLPFPPCETVNFDLLQLPIDDLVDQNTSMFADLMRVEGGQFARQQEFEGILGLLGNPRTTEAFLDAQHAGRDLDDIRQRNYILQWTKERNVFVRRQLTHLASQFREGAYPGLLTVDRIEEGERQLIRSFAQQQKQMAAAVLGDADPLLAVQAMEQIVADNAAGPLLDAHAQQPAQRASGAEAFQTPESQQLSQDLMQQVRLLRGEAGPVGSLDDRIFEKSDELKLRVINTTLRSRWEAAHKDDPAAVKRKALIKFNKERAKETWEMLEKSREESEPMLRMSAALDRILESGNGVLPTVDLVDDDPWATCLVWLEAMLQQPFQVAQKNWQTSLICFFAAKTALICPDFFSGEPLLNVSLEGREMSGKSRQLWLVQATHLEVPPPVSSFILHLRARASTATILPRNPSPRAATTRTPSCCSTRRRTTSSWTRTMGRTAARAATWAPTRRRRTS